MNIKFTASGEIAFQNIAQDTQTSISQLLERQDFNSARPSSDLLILQSQTTDLGTSFLLRGPSQLRVFGFWDAPSQTAYIDDIITPYKSFFENP